MGNYNKSSIQVKFRIVYSILTVLIIFLFSKTMYWGVALRSQFQYVAFGVVIIGVLLFTPNMSRVKKNLFTFAPLFIMVLLNIVIYWGEMNQMQKNGSIGFYLHFIVAICAAAYLPKKIFCKWYIRIVLIFCIISLTCFTLSTLNPNLPYIYTMPDSYVHGKLYFPLHTWCQGDWFTIENIRNCGPFWEPGAWAAFLSIAILMLLRNSDEYALKYRKIYFFIFLITMLSTRSTTGFIVICLIMILQYKDVMRMFYQVNKFVRTIIAIFLATFIVHYVYTSGNIEQKLSNERGNSAEVRGNDFIGGANMIIDKAGLFGIGNTDNRTRFQKLYKVNSDDSVGFWVLGYTYGILSLLIYIYIYIKSVKNFFNVKNRNEYAAILLILTILHMTQGLWNLAIFIMLLCYNRSIGLKKMHSIK